MRLFNINNVLKIVCLTLLLPLACSEQNESTSDNKNNGEGNHSSDSKNGTEVQPVICNANQVLGCVAENGHLVKRCSADGKSVETFSCSAGGAKKVCRGGACVPVVCLPQTRMCLHGLSRQECKSDGSGWVAIDACQTGQECDEGECLDECGLAKREKSYIGCDYWAFPTDNSYLYYDTSTKQSIDPSKRAPFAIVLANTGSKPAYVSIFKDQGVPAQLIASRQVARNTNDSGLANLTTVYSEMVNSAGIRVGNVLSGEAKELIINPNSTMTLLLDIEYRDRLKASITKTAFHIKTSRPMVAYQFNPLCCNYNYTNDASLLLPTATLTQRYLDIGFPVMIGNVVVKNEEPSAATLSVIATENDTDVKLKLTKRLTVDDVTNGLKPSEFQWDSASRILSVKLQRYQALNLRTRQTQPHAGDLSGTRIHATNPVAVFSGHNCAYVPYTMAACDHLESQLLPRETWSNHYIAAPLKFRGDPSKVTREGTYFKFIADEDNTTINVGRSIAVSQELLAPAGNSSMPCSAFSSKPEDGVFQLDAGQTCEFGSRTPFEVQSDKPIQIGAFLSGQNSVQNSEGKIPKYAGDPAFFIVPPADQFRSNYAFFTPPTYEVNYVTVVARAGENFSIDKKVYDITAQNNDKFATESGKWISYHIKLQDGPHTLTSDTPVGIIVYGYHNYVSYAYTGGLDLTKLRSLSDSL